MRSQDHTTCTTHELRLTHFLPFRTQININDNLFFDIFGFCVYV